MRNQFEMFVTMNIFFINFFGVKLFEHIVFDFFRIKIRINENLDERKHKEQKRA